MKPFRSPSQPLSLVFVLGLAGFLLVATAFVTDATAAKKQPQRDALVSRILDERTHVDDLDKAVEELTARRDKAQDSLSAQSLQGKDLVAEIRRATLYAGTTEVKGSGVVVRLADSPQVSSIDTSFSVNRIHDTDLQEVVNALYRAGAVAVTINDSRVAGVTPIRAAGGTILVNYRPVSSPYRVAAIGANKDTFEDQDIAKKFAGWKSKYQLGYSVDRSKNIVAAGYLGRVQMGYARVDEPPSSGT